MASVLITGGAGFIGSHTCVVLLEAGHELVVLDDFSNSSQWLLRGRSCSGGGSIRCVRGDIRDPACLNAIFTNAQAAETPIEAVIHFAGLKAVGESVADPLRYWDVNLCGSRTLLAAMDAHHCRTLVFSSTSTIYGEPTRFPLVETMAPAPIHPYAQSKLAVEQLLNALAATGSWRIANLRYFNPVGAHPSGQIGEDPYGIPNNLFPFITQIAAGRLESTEGLRKRLPHPRWHRHPRLPACDGPGRGPYPCPRPSAERRAETALTLNLGTGQGLSVLDVVHGFEQATGISIPYSICARRPGDVPRLECSPQLAEQTLGWTAKRSLADMCRDGWAWQSANPNGYRS